MAFEELKEENIKNQLKFAPDQKAQAKILSQFSNKYEGYQEGNSFILRDKSSGAEIEIPQPHGSMPSEIEAMYESIENPKSATIPEIKQNLTKGYKATKEFVKENTGPIAGSIAGLKAGAALAPVTGGWSIPATALLTAAGAMGGKKATGEIRGKDYSFKDYVNEGLLAAVPFGLAKVGGKIAKAVKISQEAPAIKLPKTSSLAQSVEMKPQMLRPDISTAKEASSEFAKIYQNINQSIIDPIFALGQGKDALAKNKEIAAVVKDAIRGFRQSTSGPGTGRINRLVQQDEPLEKIYTEAMDKVEKILTTSTADEGIKNGIRNAIGANLRALGTVIDAAKSPTYLSPAEKMIYDITGGRFAPTAMTQLVPRALVEQLRGEK